MIIISGPSTVGKNPFIYKACQLYDFDYVIPYTTRNLRNDEENGKDYYFISKPEFITKIKNHKLSEWDFCLGNYYGFNFDFSKGTHHLTHALSRMALRIKKTYPKEVTTVFLMPDNKDRIYQNLNQIYTGSSLVLRQALVEEEICHSDLFDIKLISSDNVYDLLNNKEVIEMFKRK